MPTIPARSDKHHAVITLLTIIFMNRLEPPMSFTRIISGTQFHFTISSIKHTGLAVVFAWSFCTTAFADTLYERLGGERGVSRFVDQTVDQSANDPLTKRTFDKVDLKKLKQKVAEQICALTDGPCKYTGDSMKVVHQGMDLSEAEFYGFVEILRKNLNRIEVPQSAKNELLRILAPMKRDIVTK